MEEKKSVHVGDLKRQFGQAMEKLGEGMHGNEAPSDSTSPRAEH